MVENNSIYYKEEHILLRKMVREFAENELAPLAKEIDNTGRFPKESIKKLSDLGLMGVPWDSKYGGGDMDTISLVIVIEELAKICVSTAATLMAHTSLGTGPFHYFGTDIQKEKYLTKLASGEMIGSFALTEPEAGSDAASVRTTAVRDGNGYVINGIKRYITNSPQAGLFTVFARTDLDTKGANGVSAFLVEADTPGLAVGKPDRKMGQQGAHIADVVFNDCRVTGDALVGGVEGQGFKTAMKTLDRGRIHLGAVCVAVAERLVSDSLRYAMTRKQFGQPIAGFQLVQAMLADSKTETFAGRSMVEETARQRDAGGLVATEASCCKYFCSEMVGRVADRAVQIHGGAGYMVDYGIERFYRDVRLFRIYEGTSQIQQLVIAKNMIREAGG